MIRIDTGGRRVKYALAVAFAGNIQDVQIDRSGIVHNMRIVLAGENITGSAHVSCKLIDFVKPAIDDGAAIANFTKVGDNKIVCEGRAVFRIFEIGPANPVSFLLEPRDEMVADKAASPTHQSTLHNTTLRVVSR